VEYFDAINGLEYKQHLERLNIHEVKKFKKGSPGIYGCFLSHYYLWKKCVEDNVPFLILEHDGYMLRSIPEDLLDRFTDVLKLDNVNPYNMKYNKRIESQLNDELVIRPPDEMHLGMCGMYSRGAYAYFIKPIACAKLLAWIDTNGFMPTDHMLGLDIVDIQNTYPSLARLHPQYADEGIHALSLTRNKDLL